MQVQLCILFIYKDYMIRIYFVLFVSIYFVCFLKCFNLIIVYYLKMMGVICKIIKW